MVRNKGVVYMVREFLDTLNDFFVKLFSASWKRVALLSFLFGLVHVGLYYIGSVYFGIVDFMQNFLFFVTPGMVLAFFLYKCWVDKFVFRGRL